MATVTPNGTKANTGELKQALNFLKDLLTNKLLKAVELLFKPCCQLTPVITAIHTDTGPDEFTITAKVDINFPGQLTAYLVGIFGTVLAGPVEITDGQAVFTGVTAGLVPGTVNLGLYIFAPTAEDASVGVFLITKQVVVTLPA